MSGQILESYFFSRLPFLLPGALYLVLIVLIGGILEAPCLQTGVFNFRQVWGSHSGHVVPIICASTGWQGGIIAIPH